MIDRFVQEFLEKDLHTRSLVGIFGCRHMGKRTIASALQKILKKPSYYLNLEKAEDWAKLADPELFLSRYDRQLLILDEIQRRPAIFPILRKAILRRRAQGEIDGLFLVLGSRTSDLIRRQFVELGDHGIYRQLAGINILELEEPHLRMVEKLWLRGGLPGSLQAPSDKESRKWRDGLLNSFEAELSRLGLRSSSERVRRLFSMVAHDQGTPLNASRLATALDISPPTVRADLDILMDTFFVRQLTSWSGPTRKRLVKLPRIYARDSGLVHAVAKLTTTDDLLGHSLSGLSWQGFVIEQILQVAPAHFKASYYQSSSGAKIDLILEDMDQIRIAIEIRRTLVPKISKGFRFACENIRAKEQYILLPQGECIQLEDGIEGIGLFEFLQLMHGLNKT